MNVHCLIIHHNGDLGKTLRAVADCDTVDVLTYNSTRDLIDLVVLNHERFLTVLTKEQTFEDEINKLVEKTDSHYVLILNSGEVVENITERLDKCRKNKKLAMIRAESGTNKLVVDSLVWRWLLGSQEQSIQTKVEIQAKNEGHEDWILNSIEDLDNVVESN